MKKSIKDFAMANEALRKIFGGQQISGTPQHFTFSGANAVVEARQVAGLTSGSCGCGCNGGSGSGGGAGADNIMQK